MRLFNTQKPVLSHNFQAVEGFEAADLEYPVFSDINEITGALSVLFKPDVLLRNIISPIVQGQSFSIWAMQPDGRVIYDIDEEEIGKNTFLDPIYQSFPQLLALGQQMTTNLSGTGQYEFLNTGMQNIVKKEAVWVTVGLHGTEWRLILSRVIH
jgi:branched-chain amino acid transport system substrate-binding protein